MSMSMSMQQLCPQQVYKQEQEHCEAYQREKAAAVEKQEQERRKVQAAAVEKQNQERREVQAATVEKQKRHEAHERELAAAVEEKEQVCQRKRDTLNYMKQKQEKETADEVREE